jgi:ribosomal protein L37AE/L43A
MTYGEIYKTAKERKGAFNHFCDSRICIECPLTGDRCEFDWLELEVQEEKPEVCPFCGHDVMTRPYGSNDEFVVKCKRCSYTSRSGTTANIAIALHNALCSKLEKAESYDD